MYKSWIPPAQGSSDLVALSQPRRALLAILFARVARGYNWGVCVDGLGNSLYRYYTTLSLFHDFAVYGMLPDIDRGPGQSMHDVFVAINRALQGSIPHAADAIHDIEWCTLRR